MTVTVTQPSINVREKLAELDKPTGIAGEAMLRAETPQEQFNLINAGRRNMVINGAMQVAQRGTSVTGEGDHGYYTVDRFDTYAGNLNANTFAQSQSTDNPSGFGKSLRFDSETSNGATSNTSFYVRHKFEGQDLQRLSYGTSDAQPITISFWVKSNLVGDFTLSLYRTDGTRNVGKAYTINTADTWEYKAITIAGDTTTVASDDNTFSMQVAWFLSMGSNSTAGTFTDGQWQAYTFADYTTPNQVDFFSSSSNYWQITGVQLELGKVATPFEHRSYGEELALCQRYYWQINGSDYNYARLAQGFPSASGGTYYRCSVNNPVPMRAEPSISVSGTLRAEGTSVVDWTAISSQGNGSINQVGFDIALSSSVGPAAWIDLGTSGVIKVDEEL